MELSKDGAWGWGTLGGACAICNTSNGKVCVKTGMARYDEGAGEGELVICAACGKEIAQLFGYYSKESRENLLAQVKEAEEKAEANTLKAEAFDIFLGTMQQLDEKDKKQMLDALQAREVEDAELVSTGKDI